ncbi:MAG: cell wall-binding protein [Eubacteriales bacterium]|nr:cell wall-binding protein [Eubacteriales bacterium]
MKKHTKQMIVTCAAAAFTLGTAMMSYAATGWTEEDGSWHYYDSNGDRVTDTWKKSGDHWFWLDEDGEMATDQLIEDDDDFYYVNEDGARVSNEWRVLENTDDSDDAAETAWYYFGSTGKAYKASDSGKTNFKTIGSHKYAFDAEGRMLYGWVNEESERQTDEEAWKNGMYYLGEAGDGALRDAEWVKLEVEDDENEDDDFDGTYWFYFGTNGKKLHDTTKTINGKKYRFEENGNAVFNWHFATPSSSASSSNLYYNQPEQCWLANGWFKTIPGEDVDAEAYDNGDEYWFYAQKDGEVLKSQIKKINGQYYGFNEKGEMLEGLYKLSVNDKEITSYEEIESEDDLPEADDAWDVYYFADTPKEGAMKSGTVNIDIDGEEFTYSFKKSGSERGKGNHGIVDGALYIKGQLMRADRDAKYEVVTFEGNDYLVNTSGKIQKKKTNTKDADDYYYCTDGDGIVTYKGTEKWTKDQD